MITVIIRYMAELEIVRELDLKDAHNALEISGNNYNLGIELYRFRSPPKHIEKLKENDKKYEIAIFADDAEVELGKIWADFQKDIENEKISVKITVMLGLFKDRKDECINSVNVWYDENAKDISLSFL